MGVTFWEVFSFGKPPREGYGTDASDHMLHYLKVEKRRLPFNFLFNCPETFYRDVMSQCWAFEAADRLSLEQAFERVDRIFKDYRLCYA